MLVEKLSFMCWRDGMEEEERDREDDDDDGNFESRGYKGWVCDR